MKNILLTIAISFCFLTAATLAQPPKVMEIKVLVNGDGEGDAHRIYPFVEDYIKMSQQITRENAAKPNPDPALNLFDPEVEIVGGTCDGVRMIVDIHYTGGPEDRGTERISTEEVLKKTGIRVGGNILLDTLERALHRSIYTGRQQLEERTQIRPPHIYWFQETIEVRWQEIKACEAAHILASVPRRTYDFEVYKHEIPNYGNNNVAVTWRSGGDISVIGMDREGNYRPTQYVPINPTKMVVFKNPAGPVPLSTSDDIYRKSQSLAGALSVTKVIKPENTRIWK